jgi:hypothetical protein
VVAVLCAMSKRVTMIRVFYMLLLSGMLADKV